MGWISRGRWSGWLMDGSEAERISIAKNTMLETLYDVHPSSCSKLASEQPTLWRSAAKRPPFQKVNEATQKVTLALSFLWATGLSCLRGRSVGRSNTFTCLLMQEYSVSENSMLKQVHFNLKTRKAA
jgi:hypothetical protein